MGERSLSVGIYQDSVTPGLSAECAVDGIEIVREIAPWIRIEQDERAVRIGSSVTNFAVIDDLPWDVLNADLNIVLTERTIATGADLRPSKRPDAKKAAALGEYIGLAYYGVRVNSSRVALVNTLEIAHPEFTVAHEIGHLFGVCEEKQNPHCEDEECLMAAYIPDDEDIEEMFCNCCSDQLEMNSLRLRQAKANVLSVIRNQRIF